MKSTCLVVLFLLISQYCLIAQEPDVAEGPLTDHAEDIRQLLSLKFDEDSRLVLNRGTSEEAKEIEKKAKEDEIKRMIAGGVPEETARRMMEGRRGRRSSITIGALAPKVQILTRKLRTSGSSTSRSGNNISQRFSGSDLNLAIEKIDEDLKFSLTEKLGSKRTLEVQDNKGGEFNVRLLGKSTMLMFQQSKDQSTFIGILTPQIAFRATEKNFNTLQRKYPNEVRYVSTTLRELGVDVPFSRNEMAVVQVVVNQLRGLSPKTIEELLQIVKNFDSKEFKVREQASEDIKKEFDKFEGTINFLLGSGELSLEAQSRLSIVAKEKQSARRDPRINEMIREQKLISNLSYLVELLDIAEDTTPIVEQLQQLTKQSFDSDSKQWRAWLLTQTKANKE